MSAYNQKVLSEWNIHKNWTLFLDRDGVINKRKIGDYIKIIDEFEFIPNTKEALAILDKYFNKIIIVTNQQGIGKGLMSEKDLQEVHNYTVSYTHLYLLDIDKYDCKYRYYY